jgi:transcription antitermination factor NusG
VKEIEDPLFPGYVFSRFDATRKLPVLMTPGVFDVLSFGGACVAVSEDEIEAVRALVDSRLPVQPLPWINIGDRVRITRGPLTGVEGILTAVKGNFRLVVSITILQRSVAAELDAETVEALKNQARNRGRK